MSGHQYNFGLQLGVAYKINENLSVFGGARFNYIYNKYEGNITNISADVNGNSQNLYEYFGSKAKLLTEKAAALQAQAVAAKTQADAYQAQANAATDPTAKAQLQAAANQYAAGAQQASAGAKMVNVDGVSLLSLVLTIAQVSGNLLHAMSLRQSSILRTTQNVMTLKNMRMV